jgi:mRNA interferase RelE/StbE
MDIRFIPEAVKDYNSLDGSIKVLVNKKIEKLKEDAYIGEELGHKNNINLTGYYKIYLAKKRYRIVYRIVQNEVEIIEIWGIGKRDKMEVYKEVGKRIKNRM